MKMKVLSNINMLDSFKPTDKYQIYIYVIENSDGRIKIGKTTNPSQRVISLSGSNSGGATIQRVAVMEEPTYILTLEETIHTQYNYARVPGTEWFVGITFEDVVTFINSLLQSRSFETCTKVRKAILKERVPDMIQTDAPSKVPYDPYD